MTIAFAVLEKERPGLSSWEEMGWGGGQFPTAPQLGPHGSSSNACSFAELQSMGLRLVVARVLPECLSPCFHVRRRKPSPGNKLPGVTESRAWQGLAGPGVWPGCHSLCGSQNGVGLGKDRHWVSFPERHPLCGPSE